MRLIRHSHSFTLIRVCIPIHFTLTLANFRSFTVLQYECVFSFTSATPTPALTPQQLAQKQSEDALFLSECAKKETDSLSRIDAGVAQLFKAALPNTLFVVSSLHGNMSPFQWLVKTRVGSDAEWESAITEARDGLSVFAVKNV